MRKVSCQPHEANIFSAQNIRKCERYVHSIHRKLDKAVANGNKAKIRFYVHLLAKRSESVKILAVNRVTRINDGKKTAGVDGVALIDRKPQEQQRWRERILSEINVQKKPLPIRRKYIPKPNGKKRALGIPTVSDRIAQDILRQALEPIVEYHFSDKSFGFRPKRCTQDAMSDLFHKLCRKTSKRWVVEGDISGCFDHISHQHILTTLQKWNVPSWTLETIRRMLKAKILDNGEAFRSEEGTPQGGILSPLLANVALTALDEFCLKFGWRVSAKGYSYTLNPITRYADDFVIVCQSELQAHHIKDEVSRFLREKMGLTLSDEKTRITHITKGFNFLGFDFRKYKTETKNPMTKWDAYKLIIRPQKEKWFNLLRDCKQILSTHKATPQRAIIHKLNSKLRGWGNYYRHVCSSEVFSKIDHQMWWKTFRWAKRRHPNKSKSWVLRKYFSRVGNLKNHFSDKDSKTTLIYMSKIPCSKRWVKINSAYRVHQSDKDAIEYWQKREYMNAFDSIYGSATLTKLFRLQRGKCANCKTALTATEIRNAEIHKHHMKPRSLGGDWKLSNLRLLHSECHRKLHATLSRKEMAGYVESGIDYLRLLKASKSPF